MSLCQTVLDSVVQECSERPSNAELNSVERLLTLYIGMAEDIFSPTALERVPPSTWCTLITEVSKMAQRDRKTAFLAAVLELLTEPASAPSLTLVK